MKHYFSLKPVKETGAYRINEAVGELDDGTVLTIEWPELFASKQSAIVHIERTLGVTLTEEQYRNASCFGVEL